MPGSSPLTRGKHFGDGHFAAIARLIPAHAGKTSAAHPARGSGSAHPRSRGENKRRVERVIVGIGSSPLTRGKLHHAHDDVVAVRLIPAHAGKTASHHGCGLLAPAHPRSRGENPSFSAIESAVFGSSPLTRGKRDRHPHPRRAVRLIPAHAGKTPSWRPPRLSPPAHPRSRGENAKNALKRPLTLGSSPLTRGKPLGGGVRARSHRLIPAHAGKTPRRSRARRRSWAHPRSRGENEYFAASFDTQIGSSPLTRGKRKVSLEDFQTARLIPAHAGKTPSRMISPGSLAAHPRSRGENYGSDPLRGGRWGSSPLTRGKRAPPGRHRVPGGLIPAHAGKTEGSALIYTGGAAHPRSRGENPTTSTGPILRRGSSPLTRGKQGTNCAKKSRIRLIPAHAGKTHLEGVGGAGPAAHPRSRGENRLSSPVRMMASGSSPLTRGKPRETHEAHRQGRLIPAHAGKTRLSD